MLDLIQVRSSPVHGLGVFALRDLPAGTFVAVYEGRRCDGGQDFERHREATYLFALSNGAFIDGADGGNATRHINHACQPNCKAWEVEGAGGELEVHIETLRGLHAGEELFLDYSLAIDPTDRPEDYPCRCGLSACRGTMADVTA